MTPQRDKRDPGRAIVIGEEPLTAQFAGLCKDRGIAVTVLTDNTISAEQIPDLRNAAKADGASFAAELTLIDKSAKRARMRALAALIADDFPILSASATVSTTEQAGWIEGGDRVVGISALPSTVNARLMELAPGLQTSREIISAVEDICIHLGKEISVVQDRVGLVFPRILCGLINEAFFAMMEGVAEGKEIDSAMKLGTNYPRGPVEWANDIGIDTVVAVLDALRLETGEERYRAAPLLRRMSLRPGWWHG
jgi:3-hydroxybutyryl-CoA dehydrogenase